MEADLHREVLLRLRCLDLLAATAPAAMSLAGISMGALAVSWRALLLEHHPADREGLCPACYPWRGPRPVWPCRIWHRAHRALGRYMITAVATAADQTAPDPPRVPELRPGHAPRRAGAPSCGTRD